MRTGIGEIAIHGGICPGETQGGGGRLMTAEFRSALHDSGGRGANDAVEAR